MNALGEAGGLVIPYGFVLPEGVAEAQYNNYMDPRYGKQATGSQMYWGAVGLLPYVEVSGGLANYPANVPAPFSGADHFLFRHLSGDVKVEVPQFFKYQPSIAFGITDIGGQTHFFRSKYGVVSQSFGPATFTVGYGSGDRLDGAFGGVQLALWHTGLSLLAEDDSKTPYAGIRYQSPRISWLADANVVGTLMRSLRSTDGVSPRTSFSVGIQIPLGKRFTPKTDTSVAATDPGALSQWADTPATETPLNLQFAAQPELPALPAVHDDLRRETLMAAAAPSELAQTSTVDAPQAVGTAAQITLPAALDDSSLDTIAARLFDAGLERVRVGLRGNDLYVEYENHRYNQNEADALGIALGTAAEEAPRGVERIHVVIKKADEALGEVIVDRKAYAAFLAGGSPDAASASLTMKSGSRYNEAGIDWHGDEHKHGLTRIQIEPVTSYLYGTEYGNFDFSLGANVEGFVPLWRGAELYASYIVPLYNTKNMNEGRPFSDFRIRGGLASVALGQSFWLAPQVLNVVAVGKFDYSYVGAENETTFFVPGRPDVVRLRLAYLHHEPGHDDLPTEKNAMLTYRWVQPSWNVWIEGGVARYVAGDKGPLLSLTKWFDDVSVSLQGEHSGKGSFVGAAVSFPLTPRQGMKPGITQVYGSEQFAMNFQTRVGSATNDVTGNAAENLSFPYSTQQYLLNQGRFSGEYFASQLYRMRDAYQRYGKHDQGDSKRNTHADDGVNGLVSVAADQPVVRKGTSQGIGGEQAYGPVN